VRAPFSRTDVFLEIPLIEIIGPARCFAERKAAQSVGRLGSDFMGSSQRPNDFAIVCLRKRL
jgi:hypothetical protein